MNACVNLANELINELRNGTTHTTKITWHENMIQLQTQTHQT